VTILKKYLLKSRGIHQMFLSESGMLLDKLSFLSKLVDFSEMKFWLLSVNVKWRFYRRFTNTQVNKIIKIIFS